MSHQEESAEQDAKEFPKKRKRIQPRPRLNNSIEDPFELKENKSSHKARRIFSEEENIRVELWFDKHYIDRDQHGDDFGMRDGIDNNTVENLVRRALKHMILYSNLVKGFSFLNRNLQHHERPLRIVLQEQTGPGLLNVVIEAHYLDIGKYEITVKTAMCKDDYYLSDNQYAIELDGDGSILKKKDLRVIREVSRI
ncbi:MAG: hypothetical protein ABS85_09040 [Sphingobacteriales bacterium SCN 48-20]|jgi:hypothetical protein|uniref:hypothetical protein n=1 Tax=Terrimonas ferruginea TaxID=249 RepID=UPI000869DADA|nr:hypothetical protein [Terrimonas ferruginea]MBN8783515.1 hypothetical protein [Terrimonas ferruginea]ODT92606.1 MAG: hypothetical protein ABS85_09040 [Sphingobacteriales bacterium SCN 48-20]OJW40271.1 MAG: hypothetical protein BGO56_09455 [Sphingobacteriales bacterium 48-107]